jgi:hypothetical protein
MKPEERPDPLEFIAAGQEAVGLRCPRCHCVDLRVLETRQGDDLKTRKRFCRHCGHTMKTVEIPAARWHSENAKH